MRWLALVFVLLIAALQFPMWLGKGGWLSVRELSRQVEAQKADNTKLKERNGALDAEVRDLKTGSEAIEERARSELGMVRHDEVFFQLQDGGAAAKDPGAPPATRSAEGPVVPAKRAVVPVPDNPTRGQAPAGIQR
ncbi:MAG TPA: cell division protein FtsB [Casimicrobiaceae bacterium]|nr:cell division protein FtsB [Casimicrobiaceae bacterium]